MRALGALGALGPMKPLKYRIVSHPRWSSSFSLRIQIEDKLKLELQRGHDTIRHFKYYKVLELPASPIICTAEHKKTQT